MFNRLNGCMTFMLKFVAFILICGVIGYGAITLYSCTLGKEKEVDVSGPRTSKVPYELVIFNTGNVILADDYDISIKANGSESYSLDDYWQVKNDKYIFIDAPIVLDEDIFGPIEVRERE